MPSSGDAAPARLTVALVRGVRGLRGHLRVELLTDRPGDRFTVGARLFREGTPTTLTIIESSAVADGPGWWLRFKEIPDRNAAEALKGIYLEIEPPVEPREAGRWFFHELEGLAVRASTGEELGTVIEIYRAGGAEVFVVRGPRGELDIPVVKAIVLDLAPERGEMIVDLEALALDARPVDEDYVRPRDRRPKNPSTPRKVAGEAPVPTKGEARPAKGAPRPAKGETRPAKAAHEPEPDPADAPAAAADEPPAG
jgi:16S rRNA processing protein RimM